MIPRSIVWLFAKRFIAGTTEFDALKTANKLNSMGFVTTINRLGEHSTFDKAIEYTYVYTRLIKAIKLYNIYSGISVKPSSIYSKVSGYGVLKENLSTILEEAVKRNVFVRLDMEDKTLVRPTLEVYQELKCKNLGICLPTNMCETWYNIPEVDDVRLCKGAYNVDSWSETIRRRALQNCIIKAKHVPDLKIAVATHDREILYNLPKMLPNKPYEIQMLYGVNTRLAKELLERKKRVRIYIPFGATWYEYTMRRIKENPNLLKLLFRR